MNTELRQKQKMPQKNIFLKLMKNAVFGKAMENVREHRDFTLATTERIRNYLVSEPNYRSIKSFTEHLLEILMNKPVYLGLSTLLLTF